MKFLACSLFVLLAAFGVNATLQKITVKGTAMCNGKVLPNVNVKLMERDTLDPNDVLAEVTTDSDGRFYLNGEEDEVGTIEPFIQIEHNCMTSKTACRRTSEFKIPENRVGGVFDMGRVNLENKAYEDSESC